MSSFAIALEGRVSEIWTLFLPLEILAEHYLSIQVGTDVPNGTTLLQRNT